MKEKFKLSCIFCPLFVFFVGGVEAGSGKNGPELSLKIQQYRLPNGLEVVLCPDNSLSTVAVAVFYNVGSKYEDEGRSGFAHLFEHMMFQGSRNAPKGTHFRVITSAGGILNGTTNEDYTNFFEQVPASMLELVLWLEADRMRALDVTEENFENQRAVVIEEKIRNYDNQPYGLAEIEVDRMAFEGWWPYAHPTIGDIEDLKNAKFEWVKKFHSKFYTPSNAVVVVAGNFKVDLVRKWIKKYFGSINYVGKWANLDREGYRIPSAEGKREIYRLIKDRNATVPAFYLCYHIPPATSAEFYALKLVALSLGDGDSSRLYQKLVKEKELVQEVSVYIPGRKEADLFYIFSIINSGSDPEKVRELIHEEIELISQKGLGQKELVKVKNRVKMKFLSSIQSNLSTALMLGRYKLFFGDASVVNTQIGKYTSVTNEDIKTVARKYLRDGLRVILDIVPSTRSGQQEGEE